MNYLAHALLSGSSSKVMVGNLMGDFVKGALPKRGDRQIRLGLWLHRRIDTYTDAHRLSRRSRNRISFVRRRFAGIIVDLAYDHFLAVNWSRFSHVAISDFVSNLYEDLERHRAVLPCPMQAVVPRMIREDWIGSYRTLEGLDAVMRRVGRRLSRANSLGGGASDVGASYEPLQADFLAFFPQLAEFARSEMTAPSYPAGRDSGAAVRRT